MILVFAANFIVGILLGLSSVAGFLLPIFYISIRNLNTTEALALSFFAFVISGIIGSINFYKYGFLKLSPGLWISIGSIMGSVLGVSLNLLISESTVKFILYLVVLLSGLSILFRKNSERDIAPIENKVGLIFIGLVTGVLCSLSGAGGPILVLPILILLGFKVHVGVAIALFNSIFIGIPAFIGYFINSNTDLIIHYIPIIIISHGIGVYIGSKYSKKINQTLLKKTIAIFSIVIAISNLL